MAEFRVFTQVIKVYSLNIEAEDEKENISREAAAGPAYRRRFHPSLQRPLHRAVHRDESGHVPTEQALGEKGQPYA